MLVSVCNTDDLTSKNPTPSGTISFNFGGKAYSLDVGAKEIFSALPDCFRLVNCNFRGLVRLGYWWSPEHSSTNAWFWRTDHD